MTVQQDPIRIYSNASNNTIQYNHITSYDHGGINIWGGDRNIVQYNYIFGDHGYEDFCIGHHLNANKNITRWNYCKDAGQAISFRSGYDNKIYQNKFTCNGPISPASNLGCVQFQSHEIGTYTELK